MGFRNVDASRLFLKTCVAQGVPYDETDCWGKVSLSLGSHIATDIFRLALNHWQLNVRVYKGFVYRDLLYHLIRKLDN
jgi:hypothetical protein